LYLQSSPSFVPTNILRRSACSTTDSCDFAFWRWKNYVTWQIKIIDRLQHKKSPLPESGHDSGSEFEDGRTKVGRRPKEESFPISCIRLSFLFREYCCAIFR